jgi:tryptophan-rich sensory protein
MNTYNWYQTLIKPSWAPPGYLFGPVWTFLYFLIAISFGRVFYLFYKKQISKNIVLLFVLNIFFNVIFTPIQFGLQNNILAMVDIFLVLLTLVWAMKVIYKYEKWLTYIQIPYLAWVSFATVLQVTVTYLNF